MKLFWLNLGFLIAVQTLCAQDKAAFERNLKLKIMPLSLADYTPRLRLGVEYLSGGRLAYSIDAGIGHPSINGWRLDGMDWSQDYLLWETRPEFKYIFVRKKDFYIYGATEYFYIRMRARLENHEYQEEYTGNTIQYDQATLNKQKYGMHLKAGFNLIFFNRLDVDIFGGIGFARRTILYTQVINPQVAENPIWVEWIPQPHLFEGSSTIFHLSLGFKIGVTLWKD